MNRKLSKTMLLGFIACALQVQVMAGPGLMGKLKTRDNKPVMLNGNKATSGTTVLSGAEIQSPEKIGATVDLGALGRLDLAPSTDVTLTFDAGRVSVKLRSGYVVLSTNKGICGDVTTAEGKVFETDCAKSSSVLARAVGAAGPDTAVGAAAAGGLGTLGAAGAGAGVIGGAAAAASSAGRGRPLSGDDPRSQ